MKVYDYKGELCTVKKLANLTGIPYQTLAYRLRRGLSIELALQDDPAAARRSRTNKLSSDELHHLNNGSTEVDPAT